MEPSLHEYSDYIIYVDESGDHSLGNINPYYPIFVLSFCIFRKEYYSHVVTPALRMLKFLTFGHDMVVLHEHEIRKKEGLFKLLSKDFAARDISCINIAPGLIDTDRMHEVIKNAEEMKKNIPMKRFGKPEEIGDFVKAIIENNIKYLSGVVINFDGASSNYTL